MRAAVLRVAAVSLAGAGIVAAARVTPLVAPAQDTPKPYTAPIAATRTPWATGEYLEYSLKFGAIPAGSGRMQVLGLDTLRGRATWKFRFDFSGGIPFAHVNDYYDTWVDTLSQLSLKFEQHLLELGRKHDRVYQIFPERAAFRLNAEDEKASVTQPLDEAALFYVIRTMSLEIGKSYDLNRYFDPKANPITIRVLRRDTIDVPAGRFPAIVIQPMFRTEGIFSQGGHAEVWLTDDPRRFMLQMRVKLPFGSLNLFLRKATLPPIAPGDSTRNFPT